MAQPQPEKRAMRRFPLRLPLAVKHPDKGQLPAYTRDISSRGICFFLDSPLEIGSNFEFTLTLPADITLTEPLHVRCTAHVVRVEQPADKSGLAIAAIIDRYEFLAEP